uniref:Uncharacterized protein n=1 Tax=Solanum lycopersicum TaxID=4081 RepID=K4CZE8_SOLLC
MVGQARMELLPELKIPIEVGQNIEKSQKELLFLACDQL